MGHDKLSNYYQTNFGLMQHHHWSLDSIESMMPWERYIYIDMLQQFLMDEEKKAALLEQERKAEIAAIQRKLNAKGR